jgi:hypothetical protein
LEFTIAGVGDPDAGISFLRSDWNGDFYARFGLMHGCVIVTFGKQAPRGISLSGFAFVSPRSGKVYKTYQECQGDKAT